MNTQKRRPHLRFGLKTLFVVFSAVCIVISMMTYQVQRMRSSIAAIHQLDGRVGMSNECDEDGVFVVGSFIPTSGTKFQAIARRMNESDYCRSVYFVDLSHASISNDDLRLLQGFHHLRRVALNETTIDDAGLVHLVSIGTLRIVELKSTNVTRRGMELLSEKLPKVEIDWKPKNGSIIDKILSAVGNELSDEETSAPNLEIIVDP